MVVHNTLELLVGIKALPASPQVRQFSLGISSLSALGIFGSALEVVLILYPLPKRAFRATRGTSRVWCSSVRPGGLGCSTEGTPAPWVQASPTSTCSGTLGASSGWPASRWCWRTTWCLRWQPPPAWPPR
ncbi:unnamed protein product [Ixodes pacificus]